MYTFASLITMTNIGELMRTLPGHSDAIWSLLKEKAFAFHQTTPAAAAGLYQITFSTWSKQNWDPVVDQWKIWSLMTVLQAVQPRICICSAAITTWSLTSKLKISLSVNQVDVGLVYVRCDFIDIFQLLQIVFIGSFQGGLTRRASR